MPTTSTVHGKILTYEDDAKEGIKYLMYNLNAEEAQVFFHEAFRVGSALLEDTMDRKYRLIHHGGIKYELARQ